MLTTVPEVMTSGRNVDDLNKGLELMDNLEEITLIWYDSSFNMNAKENLKVTRKHLRTINNFVVFYKDERKCIDRIRSIKNEKILLVTSGFAAENLLSCDDSLVYRSVQSIFIFCSNREKYQYLQARYPKIICICNDLEELKISIKSEVDLIKEHYETFNFYNKNEQKSICDLAQRPATFLWLLLFKDIVVQMPRDEKAKSHMIETCETYYHGNKNELNRIKEFNRTYKPHDAIRWYTRPSFVSKLINKALRIEDVDQLYIFRFFIGDLCKDIDRRCQDFKDSQNSVLYRGVRLPFEEVNKLKQNVGKLISTNGFLSTSRLKEVAMRFAMTRTENDTEEFVLFEIVCDQNTASFTGVEKDSACPKEKEILFNLGAIFEVLSVIDSQTKVGNKAIWMVHMRSTREGTEMSTVYIKENWKSLLRQSYVELFWGHLLLDMGHIEKAMQYFKRLLDSRPSNVPVQYIHFEMGRVLNAQGKFNEALQYSHLVKEEMRNKEHYIHSAAYCLMGSIYQQKGQYDLALKEFMTALEIRKNQTKENDEEVARIQASIGETYLLKGEYQHALDHFNKSKIVGEKHFPSNHVFFADYFLNVGIAHHEKGHFEDALREFEKAADIYTNYYPEGNPRILYHIGSTLCSQGKYEESLEYHHRAIQVEKKLCLVMQHTTAVSLSAIGRIHRLNGNFQNALDLFEEALQLRLQMGDPNHPDVANNYFLKGTALEMLRRHDEALVAYQEALAIQERIYPNGHRHMAVSLASIGNQHRRKENFGLAKELLEKALEMQKQFLQVDHFDISRTLFFIGLILYDQKEYKDSLNYLWKAYKIQKQFNEKEAVKCQICTLQTIGDANAKLGNTLVTIKVLEEALSIGRSFSPNHPEISELNNQIQKELQNLKE